MLNGIYCICGFYTKPWEIIDHSHPSLGWNQRSAPLNFPLKADACSNKQNTKLYSENVSISYTAGLVKSIYRNSWCNPDRKCVIPLHLKTSFILAWLTGLLWCCDLPAKRGVVNIFLMVCYFSRVAIVWFSSHPITLHTRVTTHFVWWVQTGSREDSLARERLLTRQCSR